MWFAQCDTCVYMGGHGGQAARPSRRSFVVSVKPEAPVPALTGGSLGDLAHQLEVLEDFLALDDPHHDNWGGQLSRPNHDGRRPQHVRPWGHPELSFRFVLEGNWRWPRDDQNTS